MKKQKMSLEKMKNVLSNVLSRDEMKEVMAGSGPCGSWNCNGGHYCSWDSFTQFCTGCGWFCSPG
jgi:hypothetical protein